ncbi:MAG TPA: isochorismatase family protein [Chloroflexota bacterium]|jgi:nicotinamidase-related amidase
MLPNTPDPVAVTLDPSTTAFLVLDLTTATCSNRPVCVAQLPGLADFLAKARAAGVAVIYSNTPGSTVLPEVAPAGNEPLVTSSADKFFNTNLDDLLKDRGIETKIIVGTASNGAALYTPFGANERGYTVVVADDGISQFEPYQVQLSRWQLLNQPGFANADNTPLKTRAVTLSRTDLITFETMAPGEAM